ncbi:MAG: Re/Si-specific NAD(P)(+) transhydrogenase subunit alpha [Pseudomonadota bacterium]
MGLKIAIPKETAAFEKRVAATPETVKKLIDLGCTVNVQSGAGEEASYLDSAYKYAGAKIVSGAADIFKGADIILAVQAPKLMHIKDGALVVALFAPYDNTDIVKGLASSKITGCSMELMPRITRAQSMDVLSSQSNLAGYKSVLDATEHFARAFPMMMTAAGTVPPAKVFIMGAGVAGLQAIATAKRLGAVVSATDVRPAAKEQVESLGASFVAVENDEFKEAETAGGYAKEMSKAYQKKQAALIEEHIAKQDIVITTALIPGRPAPKLVTEAMVKSMKPGSVIVDLAVETGGNCELSEPGEVVFKHDVSIIGHRNVPSRLATNASALYAKNLLNFITLLIDKESGKLAIDWDDEIVQGVTLTKDGHVIHPNFKDAAPKKKSKANTKTSTSAKSTVAKKSTAKKSNSTSTKKKTAQKK